MHAPTGLPELFTLMSLRKKTSYHTKRLKINQIRFEGPSLYSDDNALN